MQNDHKEFIDSLSKKLGTTSPIELKIAITKLGEKGLEKEYELFKQEKEAPSFFANGGKLDYLKYLSAF